jgi:7,8-dihydropterin-6-yl-methyl-4-(beta-D-ribofuranosyl)aminobenzene 5'-phosphate synthase
VSEKRIDSLKIYVLAEDYAGYDSFFWASFGISFLLRIKVQEGEKKILFDTATDAEPVLHNMGLFGISPQDIDVIVLSHNHFDHTGGLAGIVQEIGKKDIPIIAHPNIFVVSVMPEPYIEPHRSRIYLNVNLSGENSRENIEKLGGRWYLVDDPIRLMPGVMTTGEIKKEEKVAYEKEPSIKLLDLEEGRLKPSTIRDEMSLAINTDKGLVVVTGCSHPGIVSTVRKCMKLTGVKKVAGVVGGFHMIDATGKVIDQTIDDLKKMNTQEIYSGHCTGFEAEYRFRKVFGVAFKRLHSGLVIDF